MHQQQTAFENVVGKEEQAISSFPTMFFTQSENCIPICPYFRHYILFAAELEEPKLGTPGKGLTKMQRFL